ncbi:MAG: hypothetical protein ABFD25_15700 [Clostridiaceae bacterium]
MKSRRTAHKAFNSPILPVTAFIDFHSPWKWGGFDNLPHIHFGPPPKDNPDLQLVFADNLREITNHSPAQNTILYDA